MKSCIKSSVAMLSLLGMVACNGSGGSNTSSTSSGSGALKTANSDVANTVSNPYTGSQMYVDEDYQAQVDTFLQNNPSYGTAAAPYVSNGKWNVPTAVWIDRIAAIAGYTASDGTTVHGINDHMTQALTQANVSGKPVTITFVVYDLPDRDCDAYSSNGEIVVPVTGADADVTAALTTYETQYIDPLNQAINDFYTVNPSAKSLVKTVLLIEPDSLPNMITNSDSGTCKFVNDHRIYVKGIAYALDKFSTSANADLMSMYLDIAHSAWLGWQSNANQIALVYNNVDPTATTTPYGSTPYGGLGKGFDSVRGFVVNTANYTPVSEAFTYDTYLSGNSIMSSDFYAWNDVYSLDSYIAEIMSLDSVTGKLNQINGGHQIAAPTNGALYKNMHFVIDTSRNGWNTAYPETGAVGWDGKAVEYSRYDVRDANANWCNVQNIQLNGTQVSPGLGFLPQSDPQLKNPLYGSDNLPIDAYHWVKPSGTSDGNYSNVDGVVSGDQMCAPLPTTGGSHNDNLPTDALQPADGSPAPHAGLWFDNSFIYLLNNASNSNK